MEGDDHQSTAEIKYLNLEPSLHEIVAKNDVKQLTKLLSQSQSRGNKIDLDKKNGFEGKTPLHVVARCNVNQSHFKVAEVLLKNGANVNEQDGFGRVPLWDLFRNNCSLEFLKLFLRFKADFTLTSFLGSSLLTPATGNCDNLDVIQFLVKDIGLDINHKDEFGSTPLIEAAKYNQIDSHYQILEFLLENEADVNAREDHGLTPLHCLVSDGNLRVVELFLKHNADVHAVTESGQSILFMFDDKNSDVQVLQKFISDFGLDVNHQDRNKKTPLHSILLQDSSNSDNSINAKVVKCLLKKGANINAHDKDGVTPLTFSLRQIDEWFMENLDCYDFLIDQTDFCIVHNNEHILQHYKYLVDEDDYDDNDGEYYELPEIIWKWILKHLVKLKFSNIPIHPYVLEFIEDHKDYKGYFTECNKELEIMNNTKPQNSWITFFNLLVDSRRKLKNYAGNPDLIEDYKNNDWLQMFPIYGASMKKNVEKGIKRRKLFDESSIMLSDSLPIFNPNHLIVKNILDCILSKKDLSKFCE